MNRYIYSAVYFGPECGIQPRRKLHWKGSDAIYKARGKAKTIRYSEDWDDEIDEINKNKAGRPYKFSHDMMAFIAITRALLDISYRELEG